MTLGSEFTFHPSLRRKPIKEGSEMFHYQLKNGKDWQTQNTVTAQVAERIKEIMAERGRKGTHWRLLDVSKPAPKPRVRKAAKPAETVSEFNPADEI